MKRIHKAALIFLISLFVLAIGCQKQASEAELFSIAKKAQESRDYVAAVDAYKNVVAQYPNGDRADEAQFMIGFLYANDIGDTLQARTAYENFLKNYSSASDEGMVLSAKWELANLGRDIEEINEVMDFAKGEKEE